MARGAEAKLRKKTEKKEARQAAEKDGVANVQKDSNDPDQFDNYFEGDKPTQERLIPENPTSYLKGSDSDGSDEEPETAEERAQKGMRKQNKMKKNVEVDLNKDGDGIMSYLKNIKPLPLLFLLLMVGGSALPGIIFLYDNMGAMLGSTTVGKMGYHMGIGQTPVKRVVSFYEKHGPENLHKVDKLMGDYYGKYPELTKKLERKYHDYGYFLNWEEDDSARNNVFKMLQETTETGGKLWKKNAPFSLQSAANNIGYNVNGLYKEARKFWKKQVWPVLQPYFGVPTEKQAKKQKRDDAERYGRKKKGGPSKKGQNSFRDEEEE